MNKIFTVVLILVLFLLIIPASANSIFTIDVPINNTIASDPARWFGRANIAKINDSNWIMVYRDSTSHDMVDETWHIKYSNNMGLSWTANDVYLNGTATVVFPFNPTGLADNSDMIILPNGNVMVTFKHWVSGSIMDVPIYVLWNATSGAWEGQQNIVFGTNPYEANTLQFGQGSTVVENTVYATVQRMPAATGSYPAHMELYSSGDNGSTFNYTQNIVDYTTEGNDFAEADLVDIGNNTLLVVSANSAATGFYTRKMYNNGTTKGDIIDVTAMTGRLSGSPQIYRLEDNNLYLSGRKTTEGEVNYQTAVMSTNNGVTWRTVYEEHYPSDITDAGYLHLVSNGYQNFPANNTDVISLYGIYYSGYYNIAPNTALYSIQFNLTQKWKNTTFNDVTINAGTQQTELAPNYPSPISRWRFEEISGNYFYDDNLTSNRNGQFINGITRNDGAVNFDGLTQYGIISSNLWNLTSKWTIVSSVTPGVQNGAQGRPILGLSNTFAGTVNNIQLGFEDGRFVARAQLPTGAYGKGREGNTLYSAGTTYSIATSNDGTNLLIYSNGIEDTPYAWDYGTVGVQTNTNRIGLIGRSDIYYFNGTINDVQLFDTNLTAEEISDVQNNIMKSTGDLTTWYNSGAGNETYQIDINASSAANSNYSAFYRTNGTGTWTEIGTPNSTGNQSITLTTKYQNTDLKVELYGNTTATPEVISITFYIEGYTAPTTPTITIINNSKTNDVSTSNIFLSNSEAITFYVSANEDVDTWHWYVDNVLQSNNYDNFTTSWNTGTYHYVKVNASNTGDNSNTLSWGINVYPALASATISALNETPANNMKNAMSNKDPVGLINATTAPYMNLIGVYFYAFIWLIVFVMLWIKQGSMNIPMVIGIIFGGLIISFLPAPYQLVTQAFIAFGILAVVYVLFKGRG
jgi:hypothetical protein